MSGREREQAVRAAGAGAAWRARSPPGTWRLFGPALAVWACAAFGVSHPGSGRILALAAGGAGVCAIALALVAVRRRDGRSVGAVAVGTAARSVLRHGAVVLATLVLLGTVIDSGERVRADPALAQAADERRALDLEVVLRGFPKAQVSAFGGARSWVQAEARGEAGAVPVVLWLDEQPRAADWAPGARLTVRGEPVLLEPGSAAAYGIGVTQVGRQAPESLIERAVDVTGGIAARLRAHLRDAAAATPHAALVPGLAVGDTSLVGEQLQLRMQQSSLTHLVAVSGANCALVTGAAIWCAGRLGAGRRARILLAAAMLTGFVLVVGPDASVQRAALMAVVVLASAFGGKRAVSLPALGAAMLVMLLADPWQALQPGFALSVAATAGILLLVPEIERLFRRVLPVPRWAVLPVAVALSAQLACGPLLLFLQPGIPAVGVLANVVAGPAAPIGTGLGLLALVILPFSAAAGECAVMLAGLPARWISATAEVAARFPLSSWPWPEGWPGALLLAAVESALLLAWALASRRVRLPEDREAGRIPWAGTRRLSVRGRALVAGLLCASAGAFTGPVLIAPAVDRIGTPDDWSIVACDVGQGDAVLLRDPSSPEGVMLVDTGDDPESLRTCLDRFGVRRLALLVLTHDDRDHVGALGEVLDLADAALVAPENRADGSDRPVLAQLRDAGVPYRVGAAGQRGGNEGLAYEVLAPRAGSVPADTNAASLVLRVRAGGVTALLLADTGEGEQRVLRARGVDLSAGVVKVAHHGSRDQDHALAGAAGAELALISVGADNSYGHPATDTVAAFERAGTRTLRTDRHGSLAVSGTPGALRVWAERAVPVGGDD